MEEQQTSEIHSRILPAEIEDDDPVVGVANRCVDCGKLGSEIPNSEHPGDAERRCEPCWIASEEFGRRHFGEQDSTDEILYMNFQVKIGVKIHNRSNMEIRLARLRALQILMGLPQFDDSESWEHELINMEDEGGDNVPDPLLGDNL